LGGGPNGNALITNDGKDRGTALQYYTTTPVTAFMGWDNSNSEFSFGSNVSLTSDVVTYNSLGNVRGSSWLGNVDGSYANVTGNAFLSTSSGNVGIGTASPLGKLQVVGATQLTSASNYSTSTAAISVFNGSSSVNYYKADNHYFQLAAGTDSVTINSYGNVGIGTNSPAFKLEAQTAITVGLNGTNLANNSAVGSAFTYSDPGTVAAGDGKAIAIGMSGRAKVYIAAVHNGTSKDNSELSLWTTNGGVTAEAMRINNIGNVGIGNTAPTDKLSVTGNAYVSGNITANGYHIRSVSTGITANGSTQTQATALTTEINIVSTVTSGTGVRLPTAVAGTVVYITNTSANSVVVYPQTSGQINNLGANIGFTQGANATLQFIAPTTSRWYTVGATYA
jgi:hypothetical protein